MWSVLLFLLMVHASFSEQMSRNSALNFWNAAWEGWIINQQTLGGRKRPLF